jgi:hypothetical protein
MPKNDDIPGFMRKLAPSEVDIANAWRHLVEMEDKLATKWWIKGGAPGRELAPKPAPPAPTRAEMMDFATTKQTSDWRAALADPEAAEAMRQVRRRVNALKAQATAVLQLQPVPAEANSRLLNALPMGPREDPFKTSAFHQLAYDELEVGWDPNARRWTGRRGLANLEKEKTSFWNAGWGAAASDKSLDTDFDGYLARGYKERGEGHTRSWR